MTIQYTTVYPIIAKVLRDIDIQDTTLHDDIVEWIKEALDLMNTTYWYIPQVADLKIKNYKAQIPICVEQVTAVSYNGWRVPLRNRIAGLQDTQPSKSYITVYQSRFPKTTKDIYRGDDGITLVQAAIDATEAIVVSNSEWSDVYYYISDGVLETNIAEGEFKLYYSGARLDEEGWPKVPKSPYISQAVEHYVRYKLIRREKLRGNENNEFILWEKLSVRAMNDVQFPDPERMSEHIVHNVGSIHDDYYNGFEL